MIKKILVALVAVGLLAGCQSQQAVRSAIGVKPSPTTTVPAITKDTHCADLVVGIWARGATPGSYDCLGPHFQFQLKLLYGVTDDKSFAAYEGAATTTYTPVKIEPLPEDFISVMRGQFETSNIVAYHLYPDSEVKGSETYYINGFGLIFGLDGNGKVIAIQNTTSR